MKVNKICCIGAGYVGGPTMSVIALKCPHIEVTVVDINPQRIDAWNGPLEDLPVYEPGLKDVIAKSRGKNLFFSNEINAAIDRADMIFMAVNTPTKTEGEGAGMAADLKYIKSCAKTIAKVAKSDKIVVEKSTLPVRTAEKIKEILDKYGRDDVQFEILSNPEFLAEGTAIQNLFKSDRVLIGGDETNNGQKAIQALVDIYANWIPLEKILTTNVWSSELAKLASNAMLAQRISSINSLSALCEKTGAKIDQLSKAIGMDHRIGNKFLEVSVGFGGSCFKKDILNLVYLCKYYGLDDVADYWHKVISINDFQKNRFAKKIIDVFNGQVKDKVILILGWAFKANTNDSRESASIDVVNYLLKAGATIKVYDPKVSFKQMKLDLSNLWTLNQIKDEQQIKLINRFFTVNQLEKEVLNSDAIGILTEWENFKNFNWGQIIDTTYVFDGRKILNEKTYNSNKLYSIGS